MALLSMGGSLKQLAPLPAFRQRDCVRNVSSRPTSSHGLHLTSKDVPDRDVWTGALQCRQTPRLTSVPNQSQQSTLVPAQVELLRPAYWRLEHGSTMQDMQAGLQHVSVILTQDYDRARLLWQHVVASWPAWSASMFEYATGVLPAWHAIMCAALPAADIRAPAAMQQLVSSVSSTAKDVGDNIQRLQQLVRPASILSNNKGSGADTAVAMGSTHPTAAPTAAELAATPQVSQYATGVLPAWLVIMCAALHACYADIRATAAMQQLVSSVSSTAQDVGDKLQRLQQLVPASILTNSKGSGADTVVAMDLTHPTAAPTAAGLAITAQVSSDSSSTCSSPVVAVGRSDSASIAEGAGPPSRRSSKQPSIDAKLQSFGRSPNLAATLTGAGASLVLLAGIECRSKQHKAQDVEECLRQPAQLQMTAEPLAAQHAQPRRVLYTDQGLPCGFVAAEPSVSIGRTPAVGMTQVRAELLQNAAIRAKRMHLQQQQPSVQSSAAVPQAARQSSSLPQQSRDIGAGVVAAGVLSGSPSSNRSLRRPQWPGAGAMAAFAAAAAYPWLCHFVV